MKNLFLLLLLVLFSAPARAALSPQDLATAKSLFSTTVQEQKPVSTWVLAMHSKFGGTTVNVLKSILNSAQNTDMMRWASLIGIAKMSGKKSLDTLKTYMSHQSWLLRDAAIQSAVALQATELEMDIESRLNDNALVVRTSAVDAIGALRLKKASPKLVSALFDPANIHGGKALWIHRHILKVLRDFNYSAAIPRLEELQRKLPQDKNLAADVRATIRALRRSS